MSYTFGPTRVLILVDIQNDFLSGGALAVPQGDEVVAVANRLMSAGLYKAVVASQDWHPPRHGSFASTHKVAPFTQGVLGGRPQTMWPDHCIWDSLGAALAPTLMRHTITKIIPKGMNRQADSYSAFKDDDGAPTGLLHWLQANMIRHVDIMGLATDYCVKATALDARPMGMNVRVIRDGCRAVNLTPGDDERAFTEMVKAGCRVVTAETALATWRD